MQTLILLPKDLTAEGRRVPYDELELFHFNVEDTVINTHSIIMFVDVEDDVDNPIEIYLKAQTQ
jgi:hypothetical protein